MCQHKLAFCSLINSTRADSTLRAGDLDLTGETLRSQKCPVHGRNRINIVSPHPLLYFQTNREGEFSLDSIGGKHNYERLYKYGGKAPWTFCEKSIDFESFPLSSQESFGWLLTCETVACAVVVVTVP